MAPDLTIVIVTGIIAVIVAIIKFVPRRKNNSKIEESLETISTDIGLIQSDVNVIKNDYSHMHNWVKSISERVTTLEKKQMSAGG